MDELFDATRSDLEASNYILSISLDEALSLCRRGEFETAKQRAIVIAGLFDRLADRVLATSFRRSRTTVPILGLFRMCNRCPRPIFEALPRNGFR